MGKSRFFILILTTLLVAGLTAFSSDIYTPAFFDMSDDFNVSIEHIQRSITFFMLAVSISQLIYGPLSDGVGRRKPLIAGLIIMLIGSNICYFALNINILLVGRFVQGLGAGSCACLWRSIFRDSFNSAQIAKYGSYLGIMMTLMITSTPTLGGYLSNSFGWKASFLAIIIYTSMTFLLVFFTFKETSTHHNKERLNIRFCIHTYGVLLSSPIFMGYAICTFLTYGALFSWIIISPVLLIDTMGITPIKFGWLSLWVGLTSMTLGGFFNGKVVGHIGKHAMLRLGWGLICLSGILLIICDQFLGQTISSINISIFIFLFGATLIWPNTFAGAFEPFGSIAGYTGSLYSFMQLGGGAILGYFSSFLPGTSAWPSAIIFISTSLLALVIFEYTIVKINNQLKFGVS